MSVGRRIRDLRWEHRLKQRELARLAGIAQNTLSRIELGATTPSVPTLEKIAQALGMDASDLLEEAEQPMLSRPEVQAWLAAAGHMTEAEFLLWAEGLEDEGDIEQAIHDLHAKRDELLAALRTSEVRKALFPVPPGFSEVETRKWLLQPPGRWELGWEIKREYLAREVALVNYSRQLFAEGKASDYLVYGTPGDHDHERHELLLEERRRMLRESYAKAVAG